ncbi:type II toxin-antitoxin system HipA family toxin YjjJ [Cognatiluteimonas profundi]|uniref:type II toxin-antitoxin system HipA family toxin YjjJ n=1 Tax=Cognatiluteimonas profundi TaxID=2594501 RepID=UPI00131BB0A4|nr:type II toxin-antitoxin system HipA family toxin YjjJ [Lysobacter profundi]
MPPTHLPQLEAILRTHGVVTARFLAGRMGISQPTVSRTLALAGDRVLRIGQARSSRYALTRDIARAGGRWPLYRVDPDGHAQLLGQLRALHGDGYHFEPSGRSSGLLPDSFGDGLFPALPWFLDDQRPQGFLGRAFAHRVAANIGAPDDLARWQPDDLVLALLRHGDDQPGDLVLGEKALHRALQGILHPDAIATDARDSRYPQLADAALRGEDIGSSAGGEQPKFAITLRQDNGTLSPVIVKFSERGDTPAARRWADLLACEHIAGTTLQAFGQPAADSDILQAGGRSFLQSTRFDRTPRLGRRGFVSLAAIDAAFYGHGRIDWWRLAPQLQRDGWIDADDASRLAVLGWFGALIANSDMHLGNAALTLSDSRPFALAPAYDMLPMHFRPASTGEIVPRDFIVPLPTPEHRDAWQIAAAIALAFWQRTSGDPGISDAFRRICADASVDLERAIAHIASG